MKKTYQFFISTIIYLSIFNLTCLANISESSSISTATSIYTSEQIKIYLTKTNTASQDEYKTVTISLQSGKPYSTKMVSIPTGYETISATFSYQINGEDNSTVTVVIGNKSTVFSSVNSASGILLENHQASIPVSVLANGNFNFYSINIQIKCKRIVSTLNG